MRNQINTFGYLYIAVLAIARRLNIRDSAFSIDFKSILDKKNGKFIDVNRKKFRKKIFDMIMKAKYLKGRKKYQKAKKHVLDRIRALDMDGIYYFPGKSIIWNLNERVGASGGLSLNQRTIVSYLSDRCGNSCDTSFVNVILKTARRRNLLG